MSSSPPPEEIRPVSSRRGWLRPSTWSLRARLLVGQVLLLALVCVGVGAGTELALNQYLVHQLDGQLVDAARRSAMISSYPPPPRPDGTTPFPRAGHGPDVLDA